MAFSPIINNANTVSDAQRQQMGSQNLVGSNANDMQNNFLTLLVAQLKNQDPTNPMDNSQLTSQLAQISTVSGVEKLNTTLGKISGQIDNSESLQTASLIGHGVMVPGGKILVGKDATTTQFGMDLEQSATQVMAIIKDRSGLVVDSLDLKAQTAGVHLFQWDGKQADGTAVAEGAYTVEFSASNEQGKIAVQPLNYAKVSGLIREQGNNLLDLGTFGTAPFSSVRKVL